MESPEATVQRPRSGTQQKILDFIVREVETKGYPPSVREICEAVGLRSTSTVHGHLSRLEKKGLLRRDAMKPRAIGLKVDAVLRPASDAQIRMVPLLGRVAAGVPILAEENAEDPLPMPERLLGEGSHFALAIRGDSMVNAGIHDRDYVVVRRQSDASNGDIVVAMVDGDATVKRFFRERGRFRLQPENPEMEPIYVTAVEILGRVVSVCRAL